ncbi:transposase [Ancylostoma duodenale]|uniref:Transposase n=1 Tax=Ancylostoma duodenale TaxID=51022 RepID=A0A0C2GNI6_9BILA|nr:transposase [Ancylostoma duodenale]
MDRNIVRTSHSNPRFTSSDIAREISVPNVPIPSRRTTGPCLQAAGLRCRRPVKKSFISEIAKPASHGRRLIFTGDAKEGAMSFELFEFLRESSFFHSHLPDRIRTLNVDYDGCPKVTFLEDRPAHPQNPPNIT